MSCSWARRVRRLRSELRPDAVAPLDLLRVGDPFACQHARVDPESADLIPQPRAAPRLEIGARDVVSQRLGLCRELSRRDEIRRIHGLRQLGRPVVGIDEAVHVPSELQSQRQVSLDDLRHAVTVRHPEVAMVSSAPRGSAAVDDVVGAGDEAGVVGEQVDAARRDLPRAADASAVVVRDQLLLELRAVRRRTRGTARCRSTRARRCCSGSRAGRSRSRCSGSARRAPLSRSRTRSGSAARRCPRWRRC